MERSNCLHHQLSWDSVRWEMTPLRGWWPWSLGDQQSHCGLECPGTPAGFALTPVGGLDAPAPPGRLFGPPRTPLSLSSVLADRSGCPAPASVSVHVFKRGQGCQLALQGKKTTKKTTPSPAIVAPICPSGPADLCTAHFLPTSFWHLQHLPAVAKSVKGLEFPSPAWSRPEVGSWYRATPAQV